MAAQCCFAMLRGALPVPGLWALVDWVVIFRIKISPCDVGCGVVSGWIPSANVRVATSKAEKKLFTHCEPFGFGMDVVASQLFVLICFLRVND